MRGQIATLCGIFAIPLAVAMWFIYSGYNAELNVAATEWAGSQFQGQLIDVFESVFVPERAAALDRRLEAMRRTAAAQVQLFQLDEAGLAARSRQSASPGEIERLSRDGAARMRALAAIQTLILHVGDTSALTLDPDLDSYYLMDATVVALPTVLGLLQEIAARDSWASVDAASSTARVEISASRAIAAFETALREDGNFYAVSGSLQRKLPAEIASYRAAHLRLMDRLKGIEKAGSRERTRRRFGRRRGRRPERRWRYGGRGRRNWLCCWTYGCSISGGPARSHWG